jgi:hypothetical protein
MQSIDLLPSPPEFGLAPVRHFRRPKPGKPKFGCGGTWDGRLRRSTRIAPQPPSPASSPTAGGGADRVRCAIDSITSGCALAARALVSADNTTKHLPDQSLTASHAGPLRCLQRLSRGRNRGEAAGALRPGCSGTARLIFSLDARPTPIQAKTQIMMNITGDFCCLERLRIAARSRRKGA